MDQSLQYTKVQMNAMTQKSSQRNKILSKQVPVDSFHSIETQPEIPLNVNIIDTVNWT